MLIELTDEERDLVVVGITNTRATITERDGRYYIDPNRGTGYTPWNASVADAVLTKLKARQ